MCVNIYIEIHILSALLSDAKSHNEELDQNV